MPKKTRKPKTGPEPAKASGFSGLPDTRGHFGPYGGMFAPETLMPAVEELVAAYDKARKDAKFQKELDEALANYAGRPTPITYAGRLSEQLRGARLFFKREDLLHTGSHKINNALGQILLARRMGKTRIIAETGAGQHGVAVATVCARYGLKCEIFMGEEDTHRQAINVLRMRLLGAKVHPVTSGTKTLKDAMNEALRDWISNVRETYYLLGSTAGFHPYPMMVRDFQSVIGREARAQFHKDPGGLPSAVVACVNGGSNAIGIFYGFLQDAKVKLIGVEAAGEGLSGARHAATLSQGKMGVLHGSASMVLQDENGQITPTHSIAPGLDYPGVGPEHAFLKERGRATYVSATDDEVLDAFQVLCKSEGIMPALESAHAVAYAMKLAPSMKRAETILVCMSGRGDKDISSVEKALKDKMKAALYLIS